MRIHSTPAPVPLPASRSRSGGPHISAVIRDAAIRTGFLKPREGESPELLDSSGAAEFPADARIRMTLGMAWEEWWAANLAPPGVIWHPGEVELDGLAMSPDGPDFDAEILHEVKLTWKSSARPITEQWMWLAQLKAYLRGLRAERGGRGWTTGVLDVYYVNGDYKSSGPERVIHRCDFTVREIEDNWEMLVRHAKGMEKRRGA